MLIEQLSPLTGKINQREIPITFDQLCAWRRGAFIQDVAPHLSRSEREFIISGITEEEWEAHFGGDD